MIKPDKKHHKALSIIMHFIAIAFSSSLIGISVNLFYVPQNLIGGGATAIAILVHALTGSNISLFLLIINVPIFIIGLLLVDKKFFFNSLVGMLTMTAAIELFTFLPPVTDDVFCSALAGGVLMGTGGGILFRQNSSGGGFDIVFRILHKYFSLPMGTSSVIINAMILISASFYLGVDIALYSIVAIFLSSRMVNYIVDGINYKRSANIISEKSDEISDALIQEFSHGVTLLLGQGGYSHHRLNVIQCTVNPHQMLKLKKIVMDIDPTAFITVTESISVIGGSFKDNSID